MMVVVDQGRVWRPVGESAFPLSTSAISRRAHVSQSRINIKPVDGRSAVLLEYMKLYITKSSLLFSSEI